MLALQMQPDRLDALLGQRLHGDRAVGSATLLPRAVTGSESLIGKKCQGQF
jgi:hypothetical protein